MSIFQERLKHLRDSRGATQVKISEGIGVTPQALSYYFNNREPNFETLCRIAKYFDVSTDYLLGLSEYEKPYHKNVYEETGLTGKALEFLLKTKTYLGKYVDEGDSWQQVIHGAETDMQWFVNKLLESPHILPIAEATVEYVNNCEILRNDPRKKEITDLQEWADYDKEGRRLFGNSFRLFVSSDTSNFLLFSCQEAFLNFVKSLSGE